MNAVRILLGNNDCGGSVYVQYGNASRSRSDFICPD
jgi:hypothetical protein